MKKHQDRVPLITWSLFVVLIILTLQTISTEAAVPVRTPQRVKEATTYDEGHGLPDDVDEGSYEREETVKQDVGRPIKAKPKPTPPPPRVRPSKNAAQEFSPPEEEDRRLRQQQRYRQREHNSNERFVEIGKSTPKETKPIITVKKVQRVKEATPYDDGRPESHDGGSYESEEAPARQEPVKRKPTPRPTPPPPRPKPANPGAVFDQRSERQEEDERQRMRARQQQERERGDPFLRATGTHH